MNIVSCQVAFVKRNFNNIQNYEVGGDPTSDTGIHYPPYGAPNGPASPNAGYNYNTGRTLYDVCSPTYKGHEDLTSSPPSWQFLHFSTHPIQSPLRKS